MHISFCELRSKDVVNVVDGKGLGHIIDMVFDCKTGKTLGLIVPCDDSLFRIFRSQEQIFIPWHHICKIGADVILVELYNNGGDCVKGCSVKQLGISMDDDSDMINMHGIDASNADCFTAITPDAYNNFRHE